ncbi:K+ transport system, NAD-binding component [Caldisphaera lagunensis DSM 15908]|uniref:K+ transport system, NAD-binding component n=1 Tax=Caldisphaera lagunensis (strain DSM 15908 / JCM 11604 / ANMR 0165 / IC-154) TaxID=1056495 RepID=L0A8Z2_CALLD|nr:NAD-binding protein [Caldisphaera lagunensis]AFZ70358.1 K+ transport system, NAD-binding component [Caldisphaera lagunensis DSM 15908]
MRTKQKWLLDILEIIFAPYSIISRIVPQLIAIALVIIITSEVFIYYQHLDIISAIYASVGLITTIGLYAPAINQMPSLEKIFLTILVGSSVAIYTTLITGIIMTLSRRSVWIDARARWRAAHMKNHIVILGEMIEVAEELDRIKADYVMIVKNEEIAKKINSPRVIIGNPSSEIELKNSGVQEASVVLIALDNDLENMTALIRTKSLNPNARIITVIHDESLTDVFKQAGAYQVIRIRRFIGRALASLALSNNIGGILLESTEDSSRAVKKHGYAVGFFYVEKGSKCDGIKISEIPTKLLPILIQKQNNFTPYFTRDTKLDAGDGLVILGDPSEFHILKEMCTSS